VKIAYLVLAHADPHQLRKLVDAIQAPWADILIHIDKKAGLAPFVDACKGADVRFHEPRRKIQWGGWMSVQIQLEMLEAMRSPQYKYYKLLSGHCYPVKSRERIREFLESHEENFMRFWGQTPRPRSRTTLNYPYFVNLIPIENFLREDRFRARPLYYLLRHPVQILYWGLFYLLLYTNYLRPLKQLIPRRKRPMPVYMGDTWWCLRHDFVEYLLDFLARRPDVLRYFKHVRPPDEYMIPSILRESGFPFIRKLMHMNRMVFLTGEQVKREQRKFARKHILFARKFGQRTPTHLESILGAGDPEASGLASASGFHGANDARSR